MQTTQSFKLCICTEHKVNERLLIRESKELHSCQVHCLYIKKTIIAI